MSNWQWLWLWLCVIMMSVAFLSSCSTGPTYRASQGDTEVVMTFAELPKVNQSVAATVQFRKNGDAYRVTQVVCDLQMPGMVMGSNRPLADQQNDAQHTVNLLFTMDGEWSVIITGTSDDGPVRFVVEGINVLPE